MPNRRNTRSLALPLRPALGLLLGMLSSVACARVPLDPSIFSNTGQPGVVALDLPGVARETGRAVVALADRRIVVAGDAQATIGERSLGRVVLARVAAQSTPIAVPGGAAAVLDIGFAGGTGFLIDDLGLPQHSLRVERMVQQPDGRLVLLVHATREAGGDVVERSYRLVRYLANGTRDTSFGSAGTRVLMLCDGDCDLVGYESADLAQEPDGKLLLAINALHSLRDGNGNTVLSNAETELHRFAANGAPDTAFGFGGHFTYDEFTGLDAPMGVGFVQIARRTDGRIALANNTLDLQLEGFGRPAVMLLRADGIPDTSFGDGGSQFVPIVFGQPLMLVNDLAALPDGRLDVAGMMKDTPHDAPRRFYVTRLTASGAVDFGFGAGVPATAQFPNLAFHDTRALAHDHRGRVYVAGNIGIGENQTQVGLFRTTRTGIGDGDVGTDGRHRYTELAVPTGLTNFFDSHETVQAIAIAPEGVMVGTGSRVARDSDSNVPDALLVFRLQREDIFVDGFD